MDNVSTDLPALGGVVAGSRCFDPAGCVPLEAFRDGQYAILGR